jgi:hypothetical protein
VVDRLDREDERLRGVRDADWVDMAGGEFNVCQSVLTAVKLHEKQPEVGR